MEDKYYSSTASIQDQAVDEFRVRMHWDFADVFVSFH